MAAKKKYKLRRSTATPRDGSRKTNLMHLHFARNTRELESRPTGQSPMHLICCSARDLVWLLLATSLSIYPAYVPAL